jgi:hypothetical protein
VSQRTYNSPACKAMDEAIDLNIEGRSPYPDRAAFINAGTPYTNRQVERALSEGSAAVVVSGDGSTEILHPDAALRPPSKPTY